MNLSSNYLSRILRLNLRLLFATVALSAQSQPQVELERTFTNLSFNRPVDLQHFGENLYVVEQRGVIWQFTNDPNVQQRQQFLSITGRVNSSGNEQGLLGLAFHPSFRTNGYFFVYYTASGPQRTVVSRFSVKSDDSSKGDPDSETVVLQVNQPAANHNGGQIAFGPDGYLYIALGDGGGIGDTFNHGQNTQSLLGTISRIDVSSLPYTSPTDNPFVGSENGRDEIFVYGLRNPWRFSFDSGTMYAADVGQNKVEEVNIVVKGNNYGWPIMEGSQCYRPSTGCDQTGLTLPIFQYLHSEGPASVTGGYVYRGPGAPDLTGLYILGDYVDGRFWGLESNGTSYLLQNTSLSPFSFGIDHQGEVYMLASNGSIYWFTPTGGTLGFESFIGNFQFRTNIEIRERVLPAARGGSGSYTYAIAPALPDGLSFDADTRTIEGTATYELPSTTFTLHATDSNGLTGSSEFKISVVTPPNQPPTVRINGIPEKINSTTPLTATFTFSKNVTGFENEDVTVTGGSKRSFSGSGKIYTLIVMPTSGSDVEVKVDANAATDGVRSGPIRSQSRTAIWDASIPTVEISGVPTKINATSPFTAVFTFSEDVTGFDAQDVSVSGGAKATLMQNRNVYSVEITPSENSDVVVSVRAGAATDGLNSGPVSEQSATATWDTTPPSVEILDLPRKINSTAEITATFSFNEVVTGFDIDDVSVNGAKKGTFSGTGSKYSLSVTPTSGSNVVVTVMANVATDDVNTGPALSISATATWDEDAPTVEITNVPPRISSNTPFTVTFTFDESVTEFDTDDVSVAGGKKGNFSATSASVYTLIIMPSGSTNVTVSVQANAATDGANTGPSEAQSATAVWVADAPTVTIEGVPPKINSKTPFNVTFTFSEAISGFESNDITVNGGTIGSLSQGSEVLYLYTIAVTPTGSEDVTVTVRADAVTNGTHTGPASDASVAAVWDIDPPTLTIGGLPNMINSTASLEISFIFGEDVTGFTPQDVTVTGGAEGRLTGSADTYILTVTPTGTENLVVRVPVNAVTDGLNSGPSSEASATAIWDATRPGVTISGVPPRINTKEAFTAIFTFTEDVIEFESSDITITAGNKGTLSGSGASYTMNITPVGESDVIVSVKSNGATDGLNRGPASLISVTSEWDDVPPTLEILGLPPKIGTTSDLTAIFTFSEDVVGFRSNDINLSGGSKGAFSGTGKSYSLSITPSDGSDVVVSVPANSASDGLNLGPVSRTRVTSAWDVTPPNLSISGIPSTINSKAAFVVTFTFSEDVNGFEAGDISVTGGTKGKFSGSGNTYTLSITPNGSTNVVITVEANSVIDGLNNGPVSAVSGIAVWESGFPSVTITDTPPKINTTASFETTFIFSEDVTGFASEDIGVSGGTKGDFSGSGTTYTLEISPSGSSDVVITVTANSVTNGSNTGPAEDVRATSEWDVTAPTLIIEGIPEKINSRSQLTAVFKFSEAVTGFETADIVVQGGTATNPSGSGNTFMLEIEPVGSEDVVMTVAADGVTDGLNTGPSSTQSVAAIWDEIAPLLTISGVPNAINTTSPFTATFTFSEEITEFQATDISVTGGAQGAFAGSAQAYTLDIIPAGLMDVIVTVDADAVSDGLNTGPASAVSAIATWMEVIPSITVSDSKATEGQPMTFSVTVDAEVSGGFKVTPSYSDDTAVGGEDYTQNTEPLTFLGMKKEVHSFAVNTIDDTTIENDETFMVQLTISGTTKEVSSSGTGVGTIIDNDEKAYTSALFVQSIYLTGIDIYLNDVKILDDVSYQSARLVEQVEIGKTKIDVVDSEASSNATPLYSDEILLIEDHVYQVILIGPNENEISSLVFSEAPKDILEDHLSIRAIHGAWELGEIVFHLIDPSNQQLMLEIGSTLGFLDATPSVQVPKIQYNVAIFRNPERSLVETYEMDWTPSSHRDGVLILSGSTDDLNLFLVWSNGDLYVPRVVTSRDDDLPMQIAPFSAGNYPNPFDENTNLWFVLEETADVEVEVTDILGRRVFMDVVKMVEGGDPRVLEIATKNWTPGVYFYRIVTYSNKSPKIHAGKMIRVR